MPRHFLVAGHKNVISSGFVSCLKALLSWRYMLKEIHDELN